MILYFSTRDGQMRMWKSRRKHCCLVHRWLSWILQKVFDQFIRMTHGWWSVLVLLFAHAHCADEDTGIEERARAMMSMPSTNEMGTADEDDINVRGGLGRKLMKKLFDRKWKSGWEAPEWGRKTWDSESDLERARRDCGPRLYRGLRRLGAQGRRVEKKKDILLIFLNWIYTIIFFCK